MAHCFTLARSKPFEGIEGITARNGLLYLDLGINPETVPLPLGDGRRDSAPPLRGTTLIKADAAVDEHGRIVGLMKSSGSHGFLLRITTHRLDLSEISRPLRHDFPRALLWVGGEGVGVPAAQAGDRRSLTQDQLFLLKESYRIIVVDKTGCVVVYFVKSGKFLVKPAGIGDVVQHVRLRAPHMASTKEIQWGLKLLRALDATDSRADPLVARMRELERGFVLNWDDFT